MTTSRSPQFAINGGDDDDDVPQQRSSPTHKGLTNAPTNFVLGRHHPGSGRNKTHPYVTNDADSEKVNGQKTETEHNLELLERLSADFGNLLNRTDISDCFLNVQGTYMAVHKCILAARSSVFAAVISKSLNRLDTDTKDQLEALTVKDKVVININKTDPDTMKLVVIYMYTTKCDINEGNAYALLDAAGRYDIKDLKSHTGRFLSSRITSNNVLMLLRAAYKYDNKLVKQRCIEYFINHAKEIIDIHELWKRFAEEERVIVAELLHWLVNKELFYMKKPQWETSSDW